MSDLILSYQTQIIVIAAVAAAFSGLIVYVVKANNKLKASK